jgi:CHAT domain-containing protein
VGAFALASDGGPPIRDAPVGPVVASPPIAADELDVRLETLLAGGHGRRVLAATARRLARDPSDVPAAFLLVRAARSSGRLDWAASFLEAMIRRRPTAAILAGYAELPAARARGGQALELIERARRAAPGSSQIAVAYAAELAAGGRLLAAVRIIEPWVVGRSDPSALDPANLQRLAVMVGAIDRGSAHGGAHIRWLARAWRAGDRPAAGRAMAYQASRSAASDPAAAGRWSARALDAALPGGDGPSAVQVLTAGAAAHAGGGVSRFAGACHAYPASAARLRADCLLSALESDWQRGSITTAARIYEHYRRSRPQNPILAVRAAVVALPLLEALGELGEAAHLAEEASLAAAALGQPDLEASFLVRLSTARRLRGDYYGAFEAADRAAARSAPSSQWSNPRRRGSEHRGIHLRSLVEGAEALLAMGDEAAATQLLDAADRQAFGAAHAGDVASIRRLRLKLEAARIAAASPQAAASALGIVREAVAARLLSLRGSTEASLASYVASLDSLDRFRSGIQDPFTRMALRDAFQDLSRQAMAVAFEAERPELGIEILERLREWSAREPAPIGDWTAELPADVAVVAYSVGSARELAGPGLGGARATVLRSSGPTTILLPISSGLLRDRTLLYESSLLAADLAVARSVGEQLQEVLIAPLLREGALAGARALYIVPDGALHLLPFAALPGAREGELLADRFAVAQAPSLELLGRSLRRRPAAGPVIAVGAGGGADQIAELESVLGSEKPSAAARDDPRGGVLVNPRAEVLLRGPRATETHWRRLASRASVIHFGGHALATPGDGGGAGLRLRGDASADGTVTVAGLRLRGDASADGTVTVAEILATELSGPTVVLLACDTAARPSRPDAAGYHGQTPSIAEAFLIAGARAVVGTLWPITERDARLLAAAFYRAGGPARGLAALDEARRALRERWPDNPRLWAGVVWFGAAEAPAAVALASSPATLGLDPPG